MFFRSLVALILSLCCACNALGVANETPCRGDQIGKKLLAADILERIVALKKLKEQHPPQKMPEPGEWGGGALIPAMDVLEMIRLANLCGAIVSGTVQSRLKLDSVDLAGFDLRRAKFAHVSLKGANLQSADMSNMFLVDVDLDEVDLRSTTIDGAHVSLSSNAKLPGFQFWQGANDLSKIKIDHNSQTFFAFHQLREAFKNAGLREEERQITAALQRANPREGLEAWVKRIFFDWTSEYGNSPGRPLWLLCAGIVLFAIPYAVVLARTGVVQRGGIWRVWQDDRLLDRYLSSYPDPSKSERMAKLRLVKAVGMGVYFSVLSAFNIGWRDLNVGNWIVRMQSREYVLRPSGWVRAVSGFQSLVSVYLLALSVLTYFGRPFE